MNVITDIDIAVYRAMLLELLKSLDYSDMAMQSETGILGSDFNIGVICFRPCKHVNQFWKDVLRVIEDANQWDQAVVNFLLKDEAYKSKNMLRVSALTNKFWARSHTFLYSPDECVMHHANCALTLTEKWIQLNEFQSYLSSSLELRNDAFRLFSKCFDKTSWIFGELSTQVKFGILRFDKSGNVSDYRHFNESKLIIRNNVGVMLNERGIPSCVFDEFYFDRFRLKILVVGRVVEGGEKMHYLIGDVMEGCRDS